METDQIHANDAERDDVVCPECTNQGFDGQGVVLVEGKRMLLRTCWECGNQFASEL